MHEYSLMERVIENITETIKLNGTKKNEEVREIEMKIGALDIHSIESFKQAFSMLAKGTLMENAELKIEIDPGKVNCPDCGYLGTVDIGEVDGHDPDPAQPCPKCGKLLRVEGGRGVSDIEIELMEKPATSV